MSPLPSVAAVLLAVSLAGCAPAMKVETARSTSARFGHYRTFVFETDPGSPVDFAPSALSARVKRRVEQLAEGLLENKGYVPDVGPSPDLKLRVSAGRRERAVLMPDSSASRFARRGKLREEDVQEGAFSIDAFDLTSGELVWHGAACVEVEPGKVDDEQLHRAVSEVLASLPSR